MNSQDILHFLQHITQTPTSSFNFPEWRQSNKESIFKMAIELYTHHVSTFRQIDLKTIYTYIEYSSFENVLNFQYKWSTLLVNALNADNPIKNHYMFVQLLHQVSHKELNILDMLFESSFIEDSSQRAYVSQNFLLKYIIEELDSSYEEAEIIQHNLLRLNLIEQKETIIDNSIDEIETKKQICLSIIGAQLTKECNEIYYTT